MGGAKWLTAVMLGASLAGPAAAATPDPPWLLAKVHRDVMAVARYVPDPPGQDIWRASTVGDCEDLALEMARRLGLLGIPARALRILVDWNGRYATWHASLLVELEGRRWRLDSLEGAPRPWDGRGIEWEVAAPGRRIVAINGRPVAAGSWRR